MTISITTIGQQIITEYLVNLRSVDVRSIIYGATAPFIFDPLNPDIEEFSVELDETNIEFEYIGEPNKVRLILSIPMQPVPTTIGHFIIYISDLSRSQFDIPFITGSLERPYIVNRRLTFIFLLEYSDISRVLDNSRVIDYKDLLTTPFRTLNGDGQSVWASWANAISVVTHSYVTNPRKAISQLRNINTLTDSLKREYARDLGINFVNLLTDQDVERLARFISLYYPTQSTKAFNQFFSYLLAFRIDVLQLWSTSPDLTFFTEFEYVPLGPTVYQGGEWYPTSHVEFQYDALAQLTQIDLKRITNLFYRLAPIHLVLERFAATLWNDPATSNIKASFAVRGMVEHCPITGYADNPVDPVIRARPTNGPRSDWLVTP